MQQMSCQILDIGLKYYLKTLDLPFYFVKKKGLMRMLGEKFRSEYFVKEKE